LPIAELTRIEATLKSAFSEERIDQLGRETGESKRLRIVTPFRLFLAVVGALCQGKVDSIADLLREFNHQNGTSVAYKAFYNRLALAGFAEFMRRLFGCLLGQLAVRTLEAEADSALAAFEDIIVQDGSSFALKATLAGVYPGRFTTVDPAAVELHATVSGFEDNVIKVTLAPDKEAERHYLPDVDMLRHKLFLADRGYPSVDYFVELDQAEGSFIIRLTRSYDPWVLGVFFKGKRNPLSKPVRLAQFLASNQGCALDLDVEFRRGKRFRHQFRLIALPGQERSMTRLCTNLPRQRFSLPLVGKLYRFRWQIELCFKEWKSYANLHAFDTGNSHIATGLIWASLCAACLKRFLAHAAQLVGRVPISTRRVAMCAHHAIAALFATLRDDIASLSEVLDEALRFLRVNAKRAHPKRDRATGRLRAGLSVVGVP
jgi:hypothetical protein